MVLSQQLLILQHLLLECGSREGFLIILFSFCVIKLFGFSCSALVKEKSESGEKWQNT
jgi:hypothetical protein